MLWTKLPLDHINFNVMYVRMDLKILQEQIETYDFFEQICDFGLAKWLPENWTHHTVSKFEGTFGFVTLAISFW